MDPNNQPQPPVTPSPAPQPQMQPQPVQPMAPQAMPAHEAGKGLSIAGFSVAIASILLNMVTLGLAALVGLGLSIAGRVQSKKGGKPSGLALAGIIISSIVAAVTFILFLLGVMAGIQYASQMNAKCQELGVGTHQIDVNGTASTLTCTSNGFDVTTN